MVALVHCLYDVAAPGFQMLLATVKLPYVWVESPGDAFEKHIAGNVLDEVTADDEPEGGAGSLAGAAAAENTSVSVSRGSFRYRSVIFMMALM
ncbi:MAG: hypothetical protein ACREWJ_00500 [Rhodoferax sp.]